MQKIFANNKLDYADKGPDVCITHPEVLRQRMDDVRIGGRISDMEFINLNLNNLPEEYDVLDSFDINLVSTTEDGLIFEALVEIS